MDRTVRTAAESVPTDRLDLLDAWGGVQTRIVGARKTGDNDGGTHVASTKQIGAIEVIKIENKGKGFRRLRVRLPQ